MDESNERSTVFGGGEGYVGTRIYTGKNIHCVCEWKGKLNILDEESVFKTGEIE